MRETLEYANLSKIKYLAFLFYSFRCENSNYREHFQVIYSRLFDCSSCRAKAEFTCRICYSAQPKSIETKIL